MNLVIVVGTYVNLSAGRPGVFLQPRNRRAYPAIELNVNPTFRTNCRKSRFFRSPAFVRGQPLFSGAANVHQTRPQSAPSRRFTEPPEIIRKLPALLQCPRPVAPPRLDNRIRIIRHAYPQSVQTPRGAIDGLKAEQIVAMNLARNPVQAPVEAPLIGETQVRPTG